MAMVNVNRKVTDQFYRYKMPKLVAKVEGKGNGIKTVIVNMVDIAKALYRPPAYPTKFFGCELGAQTQIDKKNDRYIVNGSHTNEKLQEILDLFIEKFVLCENCENPETTLVVQAKKEKITAVCAACGHQGATDMTHRLATFIVKNPPVDDSATPSKVKKVQKSSQDNGADGEKEDNESGFDGWSDDPPPPAKSDSKDEWSEDTSAEAVQKRMENLGQGIKGLTYNDDLEKTVEERFNIFFKHVKNKINAGGESLNDKEIVMEAERLDIKDRAVIALAELLLNADILTQVSKYRMLFLRFLHNNAKSQKQFLGAFELIVSTYSAQLLPKVAHILKAFYDNDLVEEEVMLEWGGKVSKKYVDKALSEKIHEKARPFLEWLKEAEEESESDDDEEPEEVEVDFTHKTTITALKEVPIKAAPVVVANGDGDDDEVNIDDI